jgi:hypothetical protein
VSTDGLRPAFYTINGMIYVIQVIYVFGFLTDELIRACTSQRTGLFSPCQWFLKG